MKFETPKRCGGVVAFHKMLQMEVRYDNLKNPAVLRWADLPKELRATATRSRDLDKIKGEIFHILGCESFEVESGRNRDAWAMRREFLGLKQDVLQLLAFVRKWGLWDASALGWSHLYTSSKNAALRNVVFPDRIWELQEGLSICHSRPTERMAN